jgi:hypothetical protein
LTGSFYAYTWDNGSPTGVFSSKKVGESVNVSGTGSFTSFNFNAGEDRYHNNVSPGIAGYLWKRTA